ncbi:MAG TPA: pectin acetylesterase-family hydrolase [Polyangiaceae bacterium]|nr:pectin acetylesterase-family hydrolase [Polyangiaceae bacterium]
MRPRRDGTRSETSSVNIWRVPTRTRQSTGIRSAELVEHGGLQAFDVRLRRMHAPRFSLTGLTGRLTSAICGLSLVCTLGCSGEDASEQVAANTWKQVLPGGDTACADGKDFSFWTYLGDPGKVVLYLQGGGACFDAVTCAFTATQTVYDWTISEEDYPAQQKGIFDFARADNPFLGYSFVYVPYCTGDVHLGNISQEYSETLTVEHRGMVNGTAALETLSNEFASASQVVVVGASAGAVASPIYGGLVSDRLPNARVTVFADGSGAYPDDPRVNAEIFENKWGSFASRPQWEENEGLEAQDWGIPRFWVQAGLHAPNMTMARFDYASDRVQGFFMTLLGQDTSDLLASMMENENNIEEAGIVQHSFTSSGSAHTIVEDDKFYDLQVAGVRLSTWLNELVTGHEVSDVLCEDCSTDP